MKCPFCGYNDTKVIDSRPTEEGHSIRRRRGCEKCGKRFTTYEKLEEPSVMIIKKDGRREVFDRKKVMNGIIKACEKRPIPMDCIGGIVDDVEKKLNNSMEKEVSSDTIGKIVMDSLRDIDEVAYVRFASVYRQFTDLNTFIKEIEKLYREK